MVIIIAQYTTVSWCSGRRSYYPESLAVRRCRVVHAGVRSTIHLRGSTWMVWRSSGCLMICMVSLRAFSA